MLHSKIEHSPALATIANSISLFYSKRLCRCLGAGKTPEGRQPREGRCGQGFKRVALCISFILIPTILLAADGVFTNLNATRAKFTNMSSPNVKSHGKHSGTFSGTGSLIGNITGNVTGDITTTKINNTVYLSRFSNLSTAKVSIGSTPTKLILDVAYTVNTLTTPSTLQLEAELFGIGTVNAGKTLTINGPFSASGQAFAGSGSVVLKSDYVRPEWFGVVPEPVGSTVAPSTDYSDRFNIAINMGIPVKLSSGVYWVNAVHTTGYLVVTGSGNTSTYLRSYTANGYAFSERVKSANWKNTLVMSDLQITGDAAGGTLGGRGGFVFGNPLLYETDIEVAGRCEFNNVAFWNCDKAFHKPYGNIGNTFNKCSWAGNQYGYYASDDGTHTMHPGNDTFNDGEFSANALAALYINGSTYTSGQTTLNQTVIEGNPGFGLFVFGYKESYVPLKLNGVHFEANHSSGSVTINGTAYTPVDVYLKDTPYAVMDSCGIAQVTLVNSTLRETNCTINTALPFTSTDSVDGTSSLISDKANVIYQTGATKRVIESYGNALGPSGSSSNTVRTIPRNKIIHSGNRIAGNDYSNANVYSFAGTASLSATTVSDGILFDSSAELTIANGQTETENTGLGNISFTSGKWYMWSADVKLMTVTAPAISATGAGVLFGDIGPLLVQNRWVTVGGITLATSTSTAAFPHIVNSTGANATLRFSAVQIVEFSTKAEAIQYFNDRLYQPSTKSRRVFFSDVAPTTGSWVVGDRVIQATPVVGQPKSWACTAGGTPGTWVSEGNL